MNDVFATLPTQFGLTSHGYVKEKGLYIYNTCQGYMKLYKTTTPPHVLCRTHAIKEALAAKGFVHTNRYIPGPGGLPYVQLGVETYVLTPYLPHEMDFANPKHVLAAAARLGAFHALGQQLATECPPTPSPLDTMRRGARQLTHTLKQVRQRGGYSDFDVLFVKNANAFAADMQRALTALEGTAYTQGHTQALATGQACLGSVKEETLPTLNDAVYLVFEDCQRDHPLNDLAALLRRYALRGTPPLLSAKDIVAAYHTAHPLPPTAPAMLHALLCYPAPFMKIITQHYTKKRNWTPGGLHSRMENVLAQQEGYMAYVQGLL